VPGRDTHGDSDFKSIGNTYCDVYPDTHGGSDGYSYSCWHSVAHADVSARQPIHDSSDWRRYRAGDD